ncbi:RrF2 family transcriptional regulator [Sphingomonas sp. SRS2]|uniref:RrF2 family transcriptional regulator n=1 Tax=Sphingomonas sp. SRS2 TaxID=133190 RepID=UPI0006184D50|nr:Rrf2 family transcriptional regulator [Sphingomonas sp. SRS2]KKC26944.1 transcriptional regulator [Sphingomonas sp. SRS2]
MAHITTSVEYGIHCLLFLVGNDKAMSSRDLAELQGISPSFLAKIFPKLEKAGIVAASEGVRGGYRLAREPDEISFLDIVDAIEGRKPLFDCQEVRGRCAVFGEAKPKWATAGICGIHAAMIRAERAMRDSLASVTLASIASDFGKVAPASFFEDVGGWMGDRLSGRTARMPRPDKAAPP